MAAKARQAIAKKIEDLVPGVEDVAAAQVILRLAEAYAHLAAEPPSPGGKLVNRYVGRSAPGVGRGDEAKTGGVASLYVAVLELLEKVADHLVPAKAQTRRRAT